MATSQGGESTGATQWAETCHHSSSAFSWQRETLDTAGGRRPASSQEEQLWQQRILFRSAPRGLPRAR